jgi:hypothetical protein
MRSVCREYSERVLDPNLVFGLAFSEKQKGVPTSTLSAVSVLGWSRLHLSMHSQGLLPMRFPGQNNRGISAQIMFLPLIITLSPTEDTNIWSSFLSLRKTLPF